MAVADRPVSSMQVRFIPSLFPSRFRFKEHSSGRRVQTQRHGWTPFYAPRRASRFGNEENGLDSASQAQWMQRMLGMEEVDVGHVRGVPAWISWHRSRTSSNCPSRSRPSLEVFAASDREAIEAKASGRTNTIPYWQPRVSCTGMRFVPSTRTSRPFRRSSSTCIVAAAAVDRPHAPWLLPPADAQHVGCDDAPPGALLGIDGSDGALYTSSPQLDVGS